MDDALASAELPRTEGVLLYLEGAQGLRCATCAAALCGHAAVISLAMGFKDAPRCVGCLAAALGRDVGEFRDYLYAYIGRHECYRAGWEWASRREGFDPAAAPACLWPAAVSGAPAGLHSGTRDMPGYEKADAEWDAGDMGCGDLVLELRLRLQALDPGRVLKVTARDLGAPEDLPAWCRITGHALVRAHHPEYWIRRKER
jgi:tRNA 2-thiouridine synthesizing protein A